MRYPLERQPLEEPPIAKPRSRVLTTTVSMAPLAEFHVGNLATAWRQAYAAGKFPFVKWAPAGDRPCANIGRVYWRAYVGGALVATRLPGADTPQATDLPRAVLSFDDAKVAREALTLEQSWVRRAAWLMKLEDGKWLLRMRYEHPEDLVPRKSSAGVTYWSRHRHPRRWDKVPDDWPRKPNGKAMSNIAAAKILGLEKVQILLGRPL